MYTSPCWPPLIPLLTSNEQRTTQNTKALSCTNVINQTPKGVWTLKRSENFWRRGSRGTYRGTGSRLFARHPWRFRSAEPQKTVSSSLQRARVQSARRARSHVSSQPSRALQSRDAGLSARRRFSTSLRREEGIRVGHWQIRCTAFYRGEPKKSLPKIHPKGWEFSQITEPCHRLKIPLNKNQTGVQLHSLGITLALLVFFLFFFLRRNRQWHVANAPSHLR